MTIERSINVISLRQYAATINLRYQSAWERLRKGEILGFRVGRRWYVPIATDGR